MSSRHRLFPTRFCLAFLALIAALLSGCSQLSYYGQAVAGELSLLSARQPIPSLIASPRTSPPLRRDLKQIQDLRAFAKNRLSLPVGGNFSSYVALDRPYVVWSVVATGALSLEPHQWCYLVVGCQGYRGYFHRPDAERMAEKLRKKGFDTWVGGVPAYSTLGWFDDPVLNTFWRLTPTERAGLIFHELAHRVVYVDGDTAFNEGFAMTVQAAGENLWLQGLQDPARTLAWRRHRRTRSDFLALVAQTRHQLEKLYRDDRLSRAQKLADKHKLIQALKQSYRSQHQGWPEPDAYNGWFAGPINNAKIAALRQYQSDIPAFKALLAECGHDFPAFYGAVKRLAEEDRTARDRILLRLKQAPSVAGAKHLCARPGRKG